MHSLPAGTIKAYIDNLNGPAAEHAQALEHVEAPRTGKASDPFRTAFEAIRDDERTKLDTVLAAHPDVINARGTNSNSLAIRPG